MTSASARSASARPGIRTRRPLENRQDGLDLGLQVADRLRRERPSRFRLELAAAAVLLDLLARPLDRVLLPVQQGLDEHDELDLPALIHAITRTGLCRGQEPELALPRS